MKLTHYQKEYLLLHFFKNDEYAGWEGIARKLLDTGKCIVAGKECIWVGGIGNFIKTSEAEDAIDCLLYNFDFNALISSKWFKEHTIEYTDELDRKISALKAEYYETLDIEHYIIN
jgi:hypothetical protein